MLGWNYDLSEEFIAINDYLHNNKRYKMVEKFSLENLETFIQNFFQGNLEPYIKSQPIPEKQDGPVTIVVGKTFQDIVL